MTNVPAPTYTATGFVPPTELQILAGVQADMNAAFGTTLNFGSPTNPTPQGQIAATMAACIGQAYDSFCALANGVDPAFAFGRLQDAIGRIYFMTRNPGSPTIAECLCIGLPNTIIPPNALIQSAADGAIYYAVSGGIIGSNGQVTLQFAAQTNGPTPCAADTLTIIYQTIPGWDTVNNPADGVLGTSVESRAQFEARRAASVQKNTVGYLNSIIAALLDPLTVPDLLDAFAVDNPNNYPVAFTPNAIIEGSISGTTLTVSEVVQGTIVVGQTVTGALSTNIGVEAGTTIVSQLSPSTWEVSISQSVGGTTLNLGGVIVPPNSLFVAAVGGSDADVAQAIWSKKAPGIPYYPGNTSYTVYDTEVQSPLPGVAYPVVFERPDDLPFVFKVTLVNNPDVPSNAQTLIQNAIVAAFAGSALNSSRARIGSLVLASTYYSAVAALGSWAEIVNLLINTPHDPNATGTGSFGATFTGSGSGTNLTVTGSAGYLSAGDLLSGTGIPAGTTIVSQTSGTTGGDGVYVTSAATTASGACVAKSSILHVTVGSLIAAGQYIFDNTADVIEGTLITAQLSGTPGGAGNYQTSEVQQVASEAMLFVVPDRTSVQVPIDHAPTINPNCIRMVLV